MATGGVPASDEFRFSSDVTLEDLRASQHQFCKERNWGQVHAPRNVLLALVGEIGELSEIFQWKGEVSKGLPQFTQEEKDRVGEEISDCLIYLVDLAEQCHIDLPAAVFNKMMKNASKYPPKQCSIKSDKYSLYNGVSTPDNEPVDRQREDGDGSE